MQPRVTRCRSRETGVRLYSIPHVEIASEKMMQRELRVDEPAGRSRIARQILEPCFECPLRTVSTVPHGSCDDARLCLSQTAELVR